MPEYVETLVMTNFVNKCLANKRILSISKNPISKVNSVNETLRFNLSAVAHHRGKETLFHFENGFRLRIQYGMTGHWKLSQVQFEDQHAMLSLELSNNRYLEFIDPRRFGRWVTGNHELQWSSDCPDINDLDLESYILEQQKKKAIANKTVCEIMLNQKVWFGVGNYIRAEALDRADIDPFLTFGELSTPQIQRLITEVRGVCRQAMEVGGGNLQSWENPEKYVEAASTWLKCYQKKEWCIDGTNRRFWYDAKWKCPFGKEKKTKESSES